MKKFRLLTLLALLMTVATGAWAVSGWTGGTYTATATEILTDGITVSSDATLTINADVTVTVYGGITISEGKTLTVVGPGTLVVNGTNGSYGSSGGDGGSGCAAVSGTIVVQDGANVTATGGKGGNGGDGDWGGRGGDGGAAFSGAVTIYGGTINANGGSGGNGGDGDPDAGGDDGNGGNGDYAFAGTLTYYGGYVNAYGGGGGESHESYGNPGTAFASAVTFVNTPTSLTDGTDDIDQNAVTTWRRVIITGPDVDVNPAGYSVTMPQDTPDASNWTGKAGSATTFSALPLENVAVGDAVTLKYSGNRRVKTVTATTVGTK